jgi:hypothetical protein
MYDPTAHWSSLVIGAMLNERILYNGNRERYPQVNKFDRKKSKKKSTAATKKAQQRATNRAVQNAKSATTKGN